MPPNNSVCKFIGDVVDDIDRLLSLSEGRSVMSVLNMCSLNAVENCVFARNAFAKILRVIRRPTCSFKLVEETNCDSGAIENNYTMPSHDVGVIEV